MRIPKPLLVLLLVMAFLSGSILITPKLVDMVTFEILVPITQKILGIQESHHELRSLLDLPPA